MSPRLTTAVPSAPSANPQAWRQQAGPYRLELWGCFKAELQQAVTETFKAETQLATHLKGYLLKYWVAGLFNSKEAEKSKTKQKQPLPVKFLLLLPTVFGS